MSEDGRSARLLTSAVNLSGEAAAGLYGGALLGVKLHRVQRVGDFLFATLCVGIVFEFPESYAEMSENLNGG